MDLEEDNQGMARPFSSSELYMQPGGSDDPMDEGWVSWAWSFVPAIVGEEDEEGEEGEDGSCHQREPGSSPSGTQQHMQPRDPIVSIGFYCTKASVTFKVIRPRRYVIHMFSLGCAVFFFFFFVVDDVFSIGY